MQLGEPLKHNSQQMVIHSACSRVNSVFLNQDRTGLRAQLLFRLPEPMDHAAQEQSAPDEGREERKKKNNEGARIFFFWMGALDTPHRTTRRIGEETSSQAVKVRTIVPAKSGSRRCQAAALPGHLQQHLWKHQEMKPIGYSGLAQSHASLPTTTTRALFSALHTRKEFLLWRRLTLFFSPDD